ncbi:hypothetical protein Btru_008549 [Bulinus truncatus]|nr:hypothetical protein Btru_008549 [Bulinus truncatus]
MKVDSFDLENYDNDQQQPYAVGEDFIQLSIATDLVFAFLYAILLFSVSVIIGLYILCRLKVFPTLARESVLSDSINFKTIY